jgi:hypothetical protein
MEFDTLMTADVSLWSEASDTYRFSRPALQTEAHEETNQLCSVLFTDSESQPRPLLSISGMQEAPVLSSVAPGTFSGNS